MTHPLKKIKSIDDDNKYTVFGYIRQMEQQFDLYSNVPAMISYLCLLYYFIDEYFDKCPAQIVTTDNRKTITKKNDWEFDNTWQNTSYGNVWIESNTKQTVKWTIRMNVSGISTYFGLVSTDNRLNENFSSKDDAPNYAFSHCGYTLKYDNNLARSTDSKLRLETNDLLTLILDTNTATISVQKNNGDLICIFESIRTSTDIKYKLAVSFYSKNSSVTLVNFECKFI